MTVTLIRHGPGRVLDGTFTMGIHARRTYQYIDLNRGINSLSKRLLLFFVVLTALIWAGCGGSKTPTPAGVAITISPTTASVAGATTQQFTATVTGSTNTAVTWQVNGVAGGDATNGTISATGLYTAPPVLPTTTTVAVTATAQADTTKTASAIVTLTAPAVTISISPTSVTVAAGATQQFTPTVTVTGSTNNAVNWSVSGVQGGDAVHGTIDTNGLYKAPAAPPKSAITVTATSQANTAFSASAAVTLQFGNASLRGTYVFLLNQGDNSSGSGFSYRGGTFQADGTGNIAAGVSDGNSGAGPATGPTGIPLTGTYSVGPDGRGAMTLTDASGSHNFSFVLTSNTRGQVIAFDSTAVTSGFIRLQDPAATAGVSGAFVFGMSGDNAGPAAAVGQLMFSGATVTGTEDTNVNGSFTPGTAVAGSFAAAGGRGTASLNGSQFVFYIIDASTLVLMDVDASGLRIAGTAFAQSSTPFSSASLGSSAFFVNGSAVSGNKPYALAARFDTDFVGQFRGGVSDVNSGGTVTSPPFTATYTVAANGRAQVTGSSNFIIWLASQKQGVVLQSDSVVVASGQLFQQQAGFQSVTGGYAFATTGANSAGTVLQVVDGQITVAGFGSLSGKEDVNSNGTLQPAQPLTGNLTIATSGRATGSILLTNLPPAVNYDFYFVNPDRFIMLSADANTVLSGIAERQCSDCQF